MKRMVLIVEGKGDVKAAATLVARSAKLFGQQVFASDPPIRAGEAKKLQRAGELERYLRLAVSREDGDEVLVLLDLDDGCAKKFALEFNKRAEAVRLEAAKPIHICFCVREYESWFLSDIDTLRTALPDYGIMTIDNMRRPEEIRGAKETLGRLTRKKKYKQISDQCIFTQKIDIKKLALASRSFRKFLKTVTAMNDADLILFCRE